MLPTSLPGGMPGGMTAARPTSPRAASRAQGRHRRDLERRPAAEGLDRGDPRTRPARTRRTSPGQSGRADVTPRHAIARSPDRRDGGRIRGYPLTMSMARPAVAAIALACATVVPAMTPVPSVARWVRMPTRWCPRRAVTTGAGVALERRHVGEPGTVVGGRTEAEPRLRGEDLAEPGCVAVEAHRAQHRDRGRACGTAPDRHRGADRKCGRDRDQAKVVADIVADTL